jgi:hypothetical protein
LLQISFTEAAFRRRFVSFVVTSAFEIAAKGVSDGRAAGNDRSKRKKKTTSITKSKMLASGPAAPPQSHAGPAKVAFDK